MRRRTVAVASLMMVMLAMAAVAAEAHDLFLRPRDFVVRAGAAIRVRVLNGTFTSSESAVAKGRLRDLTVAGPAGVTHPDTAGWTDGEKESEWRVAIREPGTHVLGASLEPKTIRLTGTQFNKYLREEGLPHIVDDRKAARQLGDPAHERYAKHVKAMVRAEGGTSSASDTSFRVRFGYEAELVPLDDPYRLAAGGTLRVLALAGGQPLVNHIVQAGGRTTSGSRIPQREVRTDADGIARFPLATRGTWYLKFIDMHSVPASAGDSVNYESRWATLTFARP